MSVSHGRRGGYASQVERETVKHNPRMDEELAHEVASLTHGAPVEARSRDFRMQEDPGPGERIDAGHRPDVEMPGALSEEEVEQRSRFARYVTAASFPAHRLELLQAALAAEAPDDVTALINRLPDAVRFDNVQQAWQALGGHRDTGR